MESITKHHIGLNGLDVYVWKKGEDIPPWHNPATTGGRYPSAVVFEYQVEVEATEGVYVTSAWGSIHDHERGVTDHEGIGYMVLGELLSAAYDPDEFFSMATEGEGGRERAQTILSMIETAETLLPALERNEKTIQRYDQDE